MNNRVFAALLALALMIGLLSAGTITVAAQAAGQCQHTNTGPASDPSAGVHCTICNDCMVRLGDDIPCQVLEEYRHMTENFHTRWCATGGYPMVPENCTYDASGVCTVCGEACRKSGAACRNRYRGD